MIESILLKYKKNNERRERFLIILLNMTSGLILCLAQV
jgi:hypothetical protein